MSDSIYRMEKNYRSAEAISSHVDDGSLVPVMVKGVGYIVVTESILDDKEHFMAVMNRVADEIIK